MGCRDAWTARSELGASAAKGQLIAACAELADKLGRPAAMRVALLQLGASVLVGKETVQVTLDARALATFAGADDSSTPADRRIAIQLDTSLKRRGHELRLVYAAPEANPAMRDDRLVQLIASGHAAYRRLLAGDGKPNTTERSQLVRLARLRFLAPDIVTAIVQGRQPVELTSRALLRTAELPLSWVDQRKALGFG